MIMKLKEESRAHGGCTASEKNKTQVEQDCTAVRTCSLVEAPRLNLARRPAALTEIYRGFTRIMASPDNSGIVA
jgi:hypothetical protein